MLPLIYEKASSDEGDYRSALRANARGFWGGQLTLPDFVGNVVMAIRRSFTLAWQEGMRSCGMNATDMNSEEFAALQGAINVEIGRTIGLGQFIEKHSKAAGGKLDTVFNRVNLWAGSYAMVRNQSMMMACADRKLKWVWNPLKEHCSDCRTLNGRVYRASIWRRYDIYPKMWRLRCRGKYCGCQFVPTDDPITPGRPPVI